MMYRMGKPVTRGCVAVSSSAPAWSAVIDRRACEVWQWLPKHRRDLVLDQAFEAVRRFCTPPLGEPFVIEGKAYSTSHEFVDLLTSEFRDRLLVVLAQRVGDLQQGDQA